MYENIILGGAQLGLNYGVTNTQDSADKESSRQLIHVASSLGIKVVDIAINYGKIFS